MTHLTRVVVTAAVTALMSVISSRAAQDLQAAARAAEEAGKVREAFGLYVLAHKALPDPLPHEADVRLRERIVRLAAKLDPPPEVPDEAQRFSVRGRLAFSQATDEDGFDAAAVELKKAVHAAPWVAAFAFNLALVQEKLYEFDAAIANLKIYELANPPDVDQAKAKRFELEYQAEKFADDLTVTYRRTGLATSSYYVGHRLWIARQRARSDDRIFEYPSTIILLEPTTKSATQWEPKAFGQYQDMARSKDAEKFMRKLEASRPVLLRGATRTIAGEECVERTLVVEKLISVRSCIARHLKGPVGYTETLANFHAYVEHSIVLSYREILEALWQRMWQLAVLPADEGRRHLHLALSAQTARGVKGGPFDLSWEAVEVKRGAIRPSILRPPPGFSLKVQTPIWVSSVRLP